MDVDSDVGLDIAWMRVRAWELESRNARMREACASERGGGESREREIQNKRARRGAPK